MNSKNGCHFCGLVHKYPSNLIVYECQDLIAFLDILPIRQSHTQIVTKVHYDYFDNLPKHISHKVIDLGQKIARAQKRLYKVERAAFLYTGGDIPHVHAHVLPLFEKTDITSPHYIKNKTVEFEEPARLSLDVLDSVAERLRSAIG